MSKELKPCPFCNGTHSINVLNFFTRDSFRKCDICGAEAPEAKTPEEAAEKWNTRPAEDALKSVIAEIAAKLAMGSDLPEDDIFSMCKDAIGEKAILDRYNEKLRERVGDLENDTDR